MILKKIAEKFFTGNTPKFWTDSQGLGQILLPLSVLYFLIKRLLDLVKIEEHKFKAKIICVGNITAGGAGKTPTAIAIYNYIKENSPSKKIAFITTGYRGRLKGPLIVTETNTPDEVGDEAFLLSNYGTSIMCKNRLEACKFAENQGFEVLILDDGLHDKRIKKDFSLCVIDGKYGFGNGLIIPAGPLRDRPDFALADAEDILIIGEDSQNIFEKLKRKTVKDLSLSKGNFSIVSANDKTSLYIAFAGIGIPQKFFDFLKKENFAVIETVSFADHHFYSDEDFEYLKNLADKQKAKLITTEKDYIKLPEYMKEITECLKINLNINGSVLNKVI